MTERIAKKSLKQDRGWTDAGIRQFLGEPDDREPNPHYPRGAPMQLYDLDRVERVETTDAYQTFNAGARRHKAAGNRAAATRKGNLRALITTPALDEETLARLFGEWNGAS